MQRHVRNRLISGLFVLVPLWITVVVMSAIFRAMASFLKPLVKLLPWSFSERAVLTISIGAFVLMVYVVGVVTAHMFGRRLVALGEAVILRIPLVKSIYGASKQVVDALSLSTRGTFKSVVLLEWPCAGLFSVGFVTGTVKDGQGGVFCRVFVPTAPNPTTGFLILAPCHEVRETDLSIEEGVKLIVSGGVIAPDTIATHPLKPDA